MDRTNGGSLGSTGMILSKITRQHNHWTQGYYNGCENKKAYLSVVCSVCFPLSVPASAVSCVYGIVLANFYPSPSRASVPLNLIMEPSIRSPYVYHDTDLLRHWLMAYCRRDIIRLRSGNGWIDQHAKRSRRRMIRMSQLKVNKDLW